MNDTINGRTPEEIKKGLECRVRWGNECNLNCSKCNVFVPGMNGAIMAANALAYIQQLERERDEALEFHKELVETNNNLFAETVEMQNEISALRKELEQVKRERDAAVECLSGVCDYCKHGAEEWLHGGKMSDFCVECCTHDYCNWQWRGPEGVE